MRIGLIADTHMPGSLASLWPSAIDLFADVDVILHAGDLHTLEVVDELSRLAPTYVSAGNGDVGIIDDRLRDTWLMELSGIQVGMIHKLPSPERKSPAQLGRYLDRHFDQTPHVVVYGHTHREGLHLVEDVLYINPGSPTLPRNQSLRLGTIGLLDVAEDHLHATILQLTDHGTVAHEEIAPLRVNRR
ncbi:MAG: YfcE family phosphodiesterase [Proteobacteria bacterium]|jgi:uncharacterized protein|nr:YfcE family phosphodiesterase [Pseudomonadota bacterium]MDA1301029.1 YfcE family phosphodiesterase [Pseudomonadota bacterium]